MYTKVFLKQFSVRKRGFRIFTFEQIEDKKSQHFPCDKTPFTDNFYQ